MVSINLLASFLIVVSLISHVPMKVHSGKISIRIKQVMLFEEEIYFIVFVFLRFSTLYPRFKKFSDIMVAVLKYLCANVNICDICVSVYWLCIPIMDYIFLSFNLCQTF